MKQIALQSIFQTRINQNTWGAKFQVAAKLGMKASVHLYLCDICQSVKNNDSGKKMEG